MQSGGLTHKVRLISIEHDPLTARPKLARGLDQCHCGADNPGASDASLSATVRRPSVRHRVLASDPGHSARLGRMGLATEVRWPPAEGRPPDRRARAGYSVPRNASNRSCGSSYRDCSKYAARARRATPHRTNRRCLASSPYDARSAIISGRGRRPSRMRGSVCPLLQRSGSNRRLRRAECHRLEQRERHVDDRADGQGV